MRRFFVPPEVLVGEDVSLPADTLHHMRTVLRLAAGEEIVLLDGRGTLCRCRIETLGKRAGAARVLHRWHEEETSFSVRLLQAVPKGDKMDLILQKGTELGITEFVPVLTGRSLPHPERGEQKRRLRWERIIQEAARQSRRPILPPLSPPLPLEQALACDAELRLILWEQESRPLAAVLPTAAPRAAAVLVGPEGGFAPEETDLAKRAGFQPVAIGPRILRTETAGFAVASILQYLYGDLGTTAHASSREELR